MRVARPLIRRLLGAAGLAASCAAGPAGALSFDYSFIAGTPVAAQNAFIAAGELWSSVLSDPITIRLTVGTAALGSGVLGQANTAQVVFSYSTVRGALVADASSANDQLAVASLPLGAVPLLINRTSQNSNSATAYLDNNASDNNTFIEMSTANAAALGLPVNLGVLSGCLSQCDGYIRFNSSFNFDYDRSNGVTSNQFDFIGIAAHEIGHVLGFISGVDLLDGNPGASEDQLRLMPLDLFRYSSASAAQGAVDFTASTTTKYFSINGGAATTINFATGVAFGDGRQASHWKDGLGQVIMDPTSAPGEFLVIGPNDRTAFDVIGWNLTAVPEPGKPVLLALGLAVLAIGIRRGRRAG
jgi:hypothetical protein